MYRPRMAGDQGRVEEHEEHAVSELAATRLHSLDALRALAALAVVFFHMPAVGLGWLEPVQRTGFVGVNLFLVISGFAIHYVWASRDDTSAFRAGAFWRRRIWRLYPAYLGVVAIAAVYAIGTHEVHHALTRYWALEGGLVPHSISLLSQVLLITAGLVATPFVDVSWTLGLELLLYGIYSAFARRLRAIGAVRLTLFSLGVALLWRFGSMAAVNHGAPSQLLGATHARTDELFLINQVPGRWFEWMLGLLAAEAWFGRVHLPWWCRRAELGVVVVIAAYLMTRHPVGELTLGGRGIVASEGVRDALFSFGFFMLLNWAIRLERRRPELLRGRTMAALAGVGLFSYSLYLLHGTTLSVFGHFFRPHPAPSPAWYASALGATLLSAWGYFRVVESRFIRKRPASKPAPASAEGGGAEALGERDRVLV